MATWYLYPKEQEDGDIAPSKFGSPKPDKTVAGLFPELHHVIDLFISGVMTPGEQ